MSTSSPETSKPLVSIVTPTIPGREAQLRRCIASIDALDWRPIEHVIVSDRNQYIGRSVLDRERYQEVGVRTTIAEINETWRTPQAVASTGAIPWQVGSLLALGEFVGFCGDDDELMPDHVSRHVETMRREEAMFSVSPIQFRAGGIDQFVIGDAFAHGRLDATGIMCYIDALRYANWSVSTEPGLEAACDYRLVRDWLAAGLRGAIVAGEPTGIHNDGWLVGRTGKPYD